MGIRKREEDDMEWIYWGAGLLGGFILGAFLCYQRFSKKELAWELTLKAVEEEKETLGLKVKELEQERAELRQRIGRLEASSVEMQTERARLMEKLTAEKERVSQLEQEKERLLKKLETLSDTLFRKEAALIKCQQELAQEKEKLQEKQEFLNYAQKELENAFKALASETLKRQSEAFFGMAKENFSTFKEGLRGELQAKEKFWAQMTQPLRETLEKMRQEIKEMEIRREGAYKGIEEQLRSLMQVYLPKLQKETEHLSRALRQPMIRGKWGEMQLKRVVEMAGMLPKCDFEEQVSFSSEGQALRPDMVVHLPGGRIIAVDAKVPFEGYIKALEEEDPEGVKEYVSQLKKHIRALAQKKYWEAIASRWKRSPEFVVLFLPAEGLFSMALKTDPELLEFGVQQKVLLATPLTLIAMLKAVAYSWQEHEMATNAREIVHLGRQLYERLRVLTEHLNDLGQKLRQTVKSYNKVLRSYEGRILITARKFENFRIIAPEKPLPETDEISEAPLKINPPEDPSL